jgi:predicted MPP superfamily phosphohydrolase
MAPFLILLTLSLSGIYAYLASRLVDGFLEGVILALPFLLVLVLPIQSLRRHRGRPSRFSELALHACFLSMGLLTYLLVAGLAGDLLGLLLGPTALRPSWIVAGAFALLAWGIWRAVRGPTVKTVELAYPDLPAELDGFRIVQLSDLHVGPTIGRRYVERVVRESLALEPDLVALTGDIGDGFVAGLKHDLEPLRDLAKAMPTYYVTGNHEYYWQADEWIAAMRDLGATVLLNRGEVHRSPSGARLLVAGVNDPAAAQVGRGHGPDLNAALAAGPDESFKLLLSHRPGFASEASRLGFDLQLSGHTHGGQFFPWTLVVRLVHKYHAGARKLGRMWIYVSQGTGSWGPTVRLGSTTEITLIRLVRESGAQASH